MILLLFAAVKYLDIQQESLRHSSHQRELSEIHFYLTEAIVPYIKVEVLIANSILTESSSNYGSELA